MKALPEEGPDSLESIGYMQLIEEFSAVAREIEELVANYDTVEEATEEQLVSPEVRNLTGTFTIAIVGGKRAREDDGELGVSKRGRKEY
jgi:hypothetical protein